MNLVAVSRNEQPLPQGWSRAMSKSQNRYYYYHVDTLKTQWHFPTASEEAAHEESSEGKTLSIGSTSTEFSTSRPEDKTPSVRRSSGWTSSSLPEKATTKDKSWTAGATTVRRHKENNVTNKIVPSTAHSMLRSSSNAPPKKKKQHYYVTFGLVQIREYERIAGIHPDVKEGPALGISWRSRQRKDITVSNYEHLRSKQRMGGKCMPLNAETRLFILTHLFDVPKEKLIRSEKASRRAQKQRQETFQHWKQDEKPDLSQELCAKLADFPDLTIMPKAHGSAGHFPESKTSSQKQDGTPKKRRSFLLSVRKSLRLEQGRDMEASSWTV